jgi:hypothetical protein
MRVFGFVLGAIGTIFVFFVNWILGFATIVVAIILLLIAKKPVVDQFRRLELKEELKRIEGELKGIDEEIKDTSKGASRICSLFW